ncbi:hypothetical protein [Chitinolyticbacter meiyuanensis]|uniref:hypothetical protein n=1 Tax=Chitinolyticbacter meiyuanensis TaxID=682798 RepID=UPI0011E58CC8|nr:hypothetical protein [Chitinolyticbacter meiyuanensis]
MLIVKAMQSMLNDAALTEDIRSVLSQQLSRNDWRLSEDPHDRTESTIWFRSCLQLLAYNRAERLYGLGRLQAKQFAPRPEFSRNGSNTLVVPFRFPQRTYGILIRHAAQTWEQVFYEICRAVIHLLDPNALVDQPRVCVIEEAVALKFAERCYEQYVSKIPGCETLILHVEETRAAYQNALRIVRKVPDSVLKTVRERAGAFHKVTDTAELRRALSLHLAEEEIAALLAPFPEQPPAS